MWCEWVIKFYYRTHRCFVVLAHSSYYYLNEGSDDLIFSVVSERHALQSLTTTLPHQGCTGDRKPEGYLKVSQELCFQALFSLILGFFFSLEPLSPPCHNMASASPHLDQVERKMEAASRRRKLDRKSFPQTSSLCLIGHHSAMSLK